MVIQMFGGRMVDLTALTADDVDIYDVAHSLALQCRFTGHCRQFYSVAQHSVLASELVKPEFARHALLHDAAEAYLSDLPTPIKREVAVYQVWEARILSVILQKFGLATTLPEAVHEADLRLFVTERDQLMAHSNTPCDADEVMPYPIVIRPSTPKFAEYRFLARFEELWSDRGSA